MRVNSHRAGTDRRGLAWGLFVAGFCSLGTPAQAQLDFDEALRQVPKLQPSEFTDLPGAVGEALSLRGCEVPQTYVNPTSRNLVRGSFTTRDALQWAALCSVADTSVIVVLDEATGGIEHELEASPDLAWLQGIGGDRVGYSRLLLLVPAEMLVERYTGYSDDIELPPFEHDALEEVFIEKASTVWYWHEGQWLALPGID